MSQEAWTPFSAVLAWQHEISNELTIIRPLLCQQFAFAIQRRTTFGLGYTVLCQLAEELR